MKKSGRHALASVMAAGLISLSITAIHPPVSLAVGAPVPSKGAMPSAVPSPKTPNVDDGDVQAITQVGDTIVIGGNFTSVSGQPRTYVAAFNKNTGVLSSTF